MLSLPLTKVVADMLTAARSVLAVYLAWLGLVAGAAALPRAMTCLVLAWVTDLLDGTFARMKPMDHQTWIGEHDLAVDVSVAAGLLLFLVLAGFLTPPIGVAYAILVAIGLWLTQSSALAMAAQAPVYLLALIAAFQHAFPYFVVAASWIVAVVVLTWPRFPKEVLPRFLTDMERLSSPRQ